MLDQLGTSVGRESTLTLDHKVHQWSCWQTADWYSKSPHRIHVNQVKCATANSLTVEPNVMDGIY